MKNKADFILGEFPPVSARQWKDKIHFDLKGEDYNSLITKTLEGIDIKPFYHSDTYRSLDFTLEPKDFLAVEKLSSVPDKETLEGIFRRDADRVRVKIKKREDLSLLPQIHKERIYADMDFLPDGSTEFQDPVPLFNPLNRLVRTGNWYVNEKSDMDATALFLEKYPEGKIEIDAGIFREAGANIVQEIAYALAEMSGLIERFGAGSVNRIRFKTAIGYHYFFEIAKFKAWRYLFQLITDNDGNRVTIFAEPLLRNKTLLDPYVNMLRAGMEVTAAALGGADEIAGLPYDFVYNPANEEARRLATNQLLLLREEAGFRGVNRFVEGTYYIEEIAFRLAEKALDLWKQIEKGGGFLKQLYKGNIQRKIDENARKEQALFDEGKLILTGTNKFRNPAEKLPEIRRLLRLRKKTRKTLIRPVVAKRLSEKVESAFLKSVST